MNSFKIHKRAWLAGLIIPLLLAGIVGATEIYISPLKASPGQTIAIPIMIDQVKRLAGIKLILTYDESVLHFKEGIKSPQTSELMHIINDRQPGRLVLVMAGAKGINGKDFPIITLRFEIKKKTTAQQIVRLHIPEVQLMGDDLKDIQATVRIGELLIGNGRVK